MSELTELAETVETPETYLTRLVGDGKKYNDNEALAKAYANADIHIHDLEDKLDELKDNQTSIEAVLEEIRKPPVEEGEDAQGTPAVTPVDPKEINELVDQRITAAQEKAIAEQNTQSTLDLLTKHYGSRDAGLRAVNKAIDGNPVFKETVDKLGYSNPNAALEFVVSRAPREGGSNTPGLGGESADTIIASGEEFTYSYCKKVRKEDEKLYRSPSFRQRMEDAYTKHGDSWFGT